MNPVSRKLKIAIIMDRFVPSRGGESYFSWLAQELSKGGHDVHLFARVTEGSPGRGYTIHSIPVWRYPRSLRTLTFLVNSARVIRRDDFDIIHGVEGTLHMNVYNPHEGVERAYLRQDFLSISNRGYFFYKYLKRYLSPQHYLKIWIQKKQYQSPRVRRIIAISKMIKNDITRYYEVSEEKITVVCNCVDLDRFHPRNRDIYRNGVRKTLGIDPELMVLLFIGNNYRLKGLEPLLSSLALLRDRFPKTPLRLLILGRGHRRRYQRLAKRIGISDLILFLGHVGEVEQFYAASDIYVHPTFYDSCSLTVLEALASGLPVVTTRFNGAADAILSKEGGEVIETPSNVENLAESIAYYFDKDRREMARFVTRQWMEKYSPANHIEDILRVYYEVAKGEES